jgi:6-phosphofructokinase
MTAIRCIGICTGSDAPGLNAVIRAVVKCAFLKYKGRSSASPDGSVDLAREILELVSGISASRRHDPGHP